MKVTRPTDNEAFVESYYLHKTMLLEQVCQSVAAHVGEQQRDVVVRFQRVADKQSVSSLPTRPEPRWTVRACPTLIARAVACYVRAGRYIDPLAESSQQPWNPFVASFAVQK